MLITENICNKQKIKEKDSGKNEKGIDPKINKIVSCRKKRKKCFMHYTKLTCARVMLNGRLF